LAPPTDLMRLRDETGIRDVPTSAARGLAMSLRERATHPKARLFARTARGRAAHLSRFEREVDPDGVLTPYARAPAR
jgi:hypothetical protein